MCDFPSGNFQKIRLGSLRRRRLQWGPSAASRTDFGSCRLGNCTFGKLLLGKIPLGSCRFGKILLEITSHQNFLPLFLPWNLIKNPLFVFDSGLKNFKVWSNILLKILKCLLKWWSLMQLLTPGKWRKNYELA